jgi:hypothetical protein
LAAGRGYSWNHDDYIANIFIAGFALSADEWIERAKINYLRRGRPEVIEHLWELAREEAKEDRLWITRRRKMSFNDLLCKRPWDTLNDEKHGKHKTAMKIFHPTWLKLLNDPDKSAQYARDAYANSKLQPGLAHLIETDLKEFIYKE